MTVKNKILQEVLTQVRAEYQSLAKALADSSAAATDPGSKAECKYDTRSLEMSYLAAGQSRQAETLQEGLLQLEDFNLRDFAVTDRIGLGALVEVEQEGVWESYLLLPAGGGAHRGFRGGVGDYTHSREPLVFTARWPSHRRTACRRRVYLRDRLSEFLRWRSP